jgi:hypothetical protein
MKKLLLPGVAALFLVMGAAHAIDQKWKADVERRCYVKATFDHGVRDMRPGVSFGDNDQVWVDGEKRSIFLI